MDVEMQLFDNSIKIMNCKSTASAYPIIDENENLIEMKSRPNICGVAYCHKCLKERQGRLMKTYKPYFDVYEKPTIRHLICTVPVIKRSELGDKITNLLENVARFHERIRKNIDYKFRAFLVIECHYQRVSDTYNFHVHYGIFSAIDKAKIAYQWNRAFGHIQKMSLSKFKQLTKEKKTLIVKFPTDKKNRPIYKTHKYAFLEYMTRRRTEQAYIMPTRDWLSYLRGRNLLKRIGFNKGYLALVTTLRKSEEQTHGLTDGLREIFAGTYDITLDITRIFSHFKLKYEQIRNEDRDLVSIKTILKRCLDYAIEQESIKRKYKQETLNNIPVIIKS